MSGCPNGCSRPFVAEIVLVGKAVGKYNLYLGGGFAGQRLCKLYRENIGEEEILEALRPIFRKFADERQPSEHFGDFVIREGFVKEVTAGTDFHE
jgi:sulfite reductase (NADPH) hemoprotein beta-component